MYISKEREKLFSTYILAFKNFVGKSMSKNAQNQVKNKGQEAPSNIDGQNAVERLQLQPFPEL